MQAVLIPLTIGAIQAFNLRGLAEMAAGNWNGICGFGVICGTYFLLVLGPRSLASDGAGLWITLAWPPVFAVGLVNAWLFRKTGHLGSCVALHMAYNTVVMLAT